MSLTFNGTAIYIYGAKRDNHGLYSSKSNHVDFAMTEYDDIAQLDGGNIQYQLGYSETDDIQALLYSAGGLSPNSEHTIVSLIAPLLNWRELKSDQVITNLPSQTTPPGNATIRWWLDIDYAVITAAVYVY
jgi:hypothetical protein